MRRFYTSFIIAIVCSMAAVAQSVPTSYYRTADGLTGADLKTALSKIIYNHTSISDYYDLPIYFKSTDSYTKNGNWYWWDMYSDIPVTFPANDPKKGFGTYMNREHSFPKSWWGGLTNVPAYVDIFHLYPSEKAANMAKSNYPLGEVATAKFNNGVVKVGYAVTGQGGGAAQVFEPSDEYKGDFARTYFYFVTCYQNLTWDRKYMYMVQQNTYPTLNEWSVNLLLKWAREDPVSEKELDRNEAVYKIQNNRNPFIDYPDLCEYIWGDKLGQPFNVKAETPTGAPDLVTPVNGMALDFGQIAVGRSEVSRLAFAGSNLKGNFTLVISGTDAKMFSIESKKLSTTLVNAEGGTSIPVTYSPTTIGVHRAKMYIQDGGLTGSIGVDLIGECLPVPELTKPVATPATDITDDSYTANWMEPDEVVDYYIVTRTRYTGSTSSSEDIFAEENSLTIDGFNESSYESYNVRSVRLGVESVRSNEIVVDHAGIPDLGADSPLGWAYYPGGVRIVCSMTHTDVMVYDIAGRLIRVVPEVNNNDIIELPYGAYLIKSRQSTTAIRVLVK